MASLLEVERIVVGLDRLQAEHFDEGSCLFAEMEPGLDDLRVVEYH